MSMDMSHRLSISNSFRGVLRIDEPMDRHVSWRAGGRADAFFQPADIADLSEFLRALPPAVPVLFVGLGSNLLVRDGGYRGVVIYTHHALAGISVEHAGFRASAGVPAPHLARYVARHGGSGAEWMAGVPGTVGGALAMNAGCYGGETWQHVVSVETIDRAGRLHQRVPAEFEIGYRHAVATPARDEWFVSALLRFDRGDEAEAMGRIRELLAKRVATQPLNLPNAGSVFRNPTGDHAARLIDTSGLKGYTVGGAQVSPKHANFIVNVGGATAGDIEAVIDHVQSEVFARTGVELMREVRIVGDVA